jgi:hypothetical protein
MIIKAISKGISGSANDSFFAIRFCGISFRRALQSKSSVAIASPIATSLNALPPDSANPIQETSLEGNLAKAAAKSQFFSSHVFALRVALAVYMRSYQPNEPNRETKCVCQRWKDMDVKQDLVPVKANNKPTSVSSAVKGNPVILCVHVLPSLAPDGLILAIGSFGWRNRKSVYNLSCQRSKVSLALAVSRGYNTALPRLSILVSLN